MGPNHDPEVVSPDDVRFEDDAGRPLNAWLWRSRSPRGVLAIAHGLGEHGGIYRSFAEYLAPAIQVDVLAIDFLGHGRSTGRRGHLLRYDQLIDNLIGASRWMARERPGLPRFILGHSNGGLVASLTLLRDPGAAEGLILSNPAFRLKYKAPPHKLAIGHALRVAAPWVTLGGALPAEELTRDPLQQILLRSDRLMHTRIGPPLFFGMRLGGIAALDRASELRAPLLMILGADDRIIDPDAGRSFFERTSGPDKALLELPGFRHDPLFERDRGLVYRAIGDWLRPRLASAAPDDPAPVGRFERNTEPR